MRRLVICGMLAVCLGLSGCLYLRELVGLGYESPKAELTGIEVVGADLTAIDLVVTLAIKNPNDFELRLNSLRYRVEAIGRELSHGRYDERFVVPAKGRETISLPFSVDTDAAMSLAKAYLTTTRELKATVFATVSFDTPIGAMTMNFKEEKPIARKS